MSNLFQRRAGKDRRSVLAMQPPLPETEEPVEKTQAVEIPAELAPAAELEHPASPVETAPAADQWDEPVSATLDVDISTDAETPWGKADTVADDAPPAPAPVPSAAEFFGAPHAFDLSNDWDQPVTVVSVDELIASGLVAAGPAAVAADEAEVAETPVEVAPAAEDVAIEDVAAETVEAPFELERPELDDLEEAAFEQTDADAGTSTDDPSTEARAGRHSAASEEVEDEPVADEPVEDEPATDEEPSEELEADVEAQVEIAPELHEAETLPETEPETEPAAETELELAPETLAEPDEHELEARQATDLALESDDLAAHAEALTQTAWTLSAFARTQSPPAQEVISFEVAALSMHTAELNYQYAVFNVLGEVELVTYDITEVLAHFETREHTEDEPQPLVQVRAIRADYWRTLDWGQGI